MRLIDADKLMNRIIDDPAVKCGNTFQHVILQIENATTVDAEPVKHAHWYAPVSYDPPEWCSNCNERTRWAYDEGYCPNCGAKMDGGTDNA